MSLKTTFRRSEMPKIEESFKELTNTIGKKR